MAEAKFHQAGLYELQQGLKSISSQNSLHGMKACAFLQTGQCYGSTVRLTVG